MVEIRDYTPTQEELDRIEQAKVYDENRMKLKKLSEDIVQYIAGENVPNIDERKAEFIRIHNEVREYEGKEPREWGIDK